ncbi:MAG: TRAP transporter fused permease subunit [Deferrisomatales bacterium]|nr:TRAP transporter fused permease subunit [Deferrisomatales bacterium]
MRLIKDLAGLALPPVAVAMAVYQLAYTQTLVQSPDGHIITHLGLALTVTFLSLLHRSAAARQQWLSFALLLFSVAVTVYLMVELDPILMFRTSFPSRMDLVVGVVLILVLMVGNWIIFGKTFTIVSLVAILYLLVGRWLPPPFTVPDVSFERLLMWLSVELGSGKGVYGDILDLSANYLFLFIFFGGALHTFGGTRFVIGLGQWVGSKLRGGPAMVALFASTFLGAITGSTVANITITGAFTIPMMKKSGYTAEQAGAIETVASNGGQITPPIMGATAFLMAGFANVPYIEIVKAAIIPAALYFLCVYVYISLTARKMAIDDTVDPVDTKQLLLDAPTFVLPLVVLVVLLVKGYTLPFVGFWSIVTLAVVGLAMNVWRKDIVFTFRGVLSNLTDSVRTACGVAMICGLLGVVVSAIVSSGLAMKLPLAIEELSGGSLPLALIITMLTSMILGIGVPTPAAYMLVALGAVPGLLQMGVPLLAAHFFCFVSAISSHITPPIAIGALVASQIAGGNYMKTAFEAMKAAFAKYLLPFFFIYAPIVMLRPDRGVVESVIQVVAILIMIVALQIAVSQYCFTWLRKDETLIFGAAAVLALLNIFTTSAPLFWVGLVLFVGSLVRQFVIGRGAGGPEGNTASV